METKRSRVDQSVEDHLESLRRLKGELQQEIAKLKQQTQAPGTIASTFLPPPVLPTLDDCHEKLQQVERAIRKARNKDYGYCKVCGAAIPLLRLRARPECRLCAICQSRREQAGT